MCSSFILSRHREEHPLVSGLIRPHTLHTISSITIIIIQHPSGVLDPPPPPLHCICRLPTLFSHLPRDPPRPLSPVLPHHSLPPTDVSLITLDPAPQALPPVVMETLAAPCFTEPEGDGEAGDAGLQRISLSRAQTATLWCCLSCASVFTLWPI